MSEYSDKFKDPRWQKKRLEILERDDFTCKRCKDKTSTLHVHHKWYDKGKNPWEYSENCFVTLCELCHETEHSESNDYKGILLTTLLSKGLLAADLLSIALNISYLSNEQIKILANDRNAQKIYVGVEE